jgi:hypothetical protein
MNLEEIERNIVDQINVTQDYDNEPPGFVK